MILQGDWHTHTQKKKAVGNIFNRSKYFTQFYFQRPGCGFCLVSFVLGQIPVYNLQNMICLSCTCGSFGSSGLASVKKHILEISRQHIQLHSPISYVNKISSSVWVIRPGEQLILGTSSVISSHCKRNRFPTVTEGQYKM